MKRAIYAVLWAVWLAGLGAFVWWAAIREKPAPAAKPAEYGSLGVGASVDRNALSVRLTPVPREKADHGPTLMCEILNNGDKPVEIRCVLWARVTAFTDVELYNASGVRISEEFYERQISSPFATDDNAEVLTIAPGGSLPVECRIFRGVAEVDRRPGKYKCRVRFVYGVFVVVSDYVELEVTSADLSKP